MSPPIMVSKTFSRCELARVQSPTMEITKYSSAGVGSGVGSLVGAAVGSGAAVGVA